MMHDVADFFPHRRAVVFTRARIFRELNRANLAEVARCGGAGGVADDENRTSARS